MEEELELSPINGIDSVVLELIVKIINFLYERYRGTCDLYIFYIYRFSKNKICANMRINYVAICIIKYNLEGDKFE